MEMLRVVQELQLLHQLRGHQQQFPHLRPRKRHLFTYRAYHVTISGQSGWLNRAYFVKTPTSNASALLRISLARALAN